jgi:predicted dehydrogenase
MIIVFIFSKTFFAMRKKTFEQTHAFNRRAFLKNSIKAGIAFTIIPRFVLGGKGYTAPSDLITLGFIGTGKQGRGLGDAFAPLTKIIACSDVDSQKLALFKSNVEKKYAEINHQTSYSGIEQYADFREMLLRKDIDAVVVATPDHWHAVASIMAANAHKHVYCEKPLGHSIEEGRAMVNAMNKNKMILQTGSMQRSWINFRHACELVRNGYIGDVKEVLVSVGTAGIPDDLPEQTVPSVLNWDRWVGPAPFKPFNAELSPPVEQDIFPNWRKYKEYGGGILSDWGAHMFDIAQWGLDMDESGPVKIFPPDGKEHQYLTMVYKNGIVMKHQDFGRGFGVRFIGTKGTLNISRDYIDSDPVNIATAEIKPDEIHLYKSDDHYKDWLNAIKNNTQPICPAETGHRTSSVCSIANIAYWLNRPLQWDPKHEKFKHDDEANALVKANIRGDWKLA